MELTINLLEHLQIPHPYWTLSTRILLNSPNKPIKLSIRLSVLQIEKLMLANLNKPELSHTEEWWQGWDSTQIEQLQSQQLQEFVLGSDVEPSLRSKD